MKKVAVLPGLGVGDAIIMMIAAHHYQKAGYEVTIFSNPMITFSDWFNGFSFLQRPSMEDFYEVFSQFDITLLQHENSDRAKYLYSLHQEGKLKQLITFYNNYRTSKHFPLKEKSDFAFDESKSMVDNVVDALKELLPSLSITKEIGLQIPKSLKYQRFINRVIIHPTSSLNEKNWSKSKFFHLAKKLISKGYRPAFCVSPKERPDWIQAQEYGIDVPLTAKLSDLAKLLYESRFFIGNDSGPGHLASYLNIPSIIFAPKPCIQHWMPGWKPAQLIKPPQWIPNIKGLRLREKKWQFFIPVSKVIKIINKL